MCVRVRVYIYAHAFMYVCKHVLCGFNVVPLRVKGEHTLILVHTILTTGDPKASQAFPDGGEHGGFHH